MYKHKEHPLLPRMSKPYVTLHAAHGHHFLVCVSLRHPKSWNLISMKRETHNLPPPATAIAHVCSLLGAENDERHPHIDRLYSCFMNISQVSNSTCTCSYFFFLCTFFFAPLLRMASLFCEYVSLLGASSPKPRDK